MTLPRRAEIIPPFGLTRCVLEAIERSGRDPMTRSLDLVINHTPRELIAFLDERAEREGRSPERLAIEILEAVLTEDMGPDRVRRDLFRFRCWLTTIDPFDLCPLQLIQFPGSTLRKILAGARQHNTPVQEMIGFHLWLRASRPWQPRLLA